MQSGIRSMLYLCILLTFLLFTGGHAQIDDPSIISIETLFAGLDTLDGEQVKVIGFYTSPGDPKLLTSYFDYLNRRPIPPNRLVFVGGVQPSDSLYWHGGLMSITGTVSIGANDLPIDASDTVLVTINAISVEYYLPGNINPEVPGLNDWDAGELFEGRDAMAGCDSCKFAILMSGGINARNQHPGFWEDIEALYKYKTDPAGGNYCPENVKVLYYKGNSEDVGAIPNAAVDSCTEANIEAAHKEIARRIADCERAGKPATVQKMVSNHGSDGSGMNLLGAGHVSPAELRAMQQELIDSCCDFMYDEFTQCYGGDFVDGLKGLDAKNKTEIHVNSAAGSGSCAWGGNSGSPYLLEKIAQLADSATYEDAVRSAKNKYRSYLDSLRRRADSLIQLIDSIKATLPPDHPSQGRLDSLRQVQDERKNDLDDSLNDPSTSWVRYIFKQYCEWKKIVVPPGGQFKLKFKGTGGCGNVSIYKENPDGTKTRVKVWNWNLPGSSGYVAGNDERVVNADMTGTGTYWIHNDNGEFEVTVDALKNQTLPESASNIPAFAGFSLGGTDNSPGEFALITGPAHLVVDIELVPLNLTSVPAIIGPCGGVGQLTVTFNPQPNPWWGGMELHIVPFQVMQPGLLQIQCPSAEFPLVQIPLAPGQAPFSVFLGAIPPEPAQLTLSSVGGLCIAMDSWGLRSVIPTFPEFICGDADGSSSVTISDAVFLINYIFGGGPAPVPLLAGDADCSGAVTISDAVVLINYIFSGGPAPCSACD